jgi:hypothetical protein
MTSSHVDVQTQSLADLKTALLAFRGSAGEQLRGIQQYLQRAWEVFERAEQGAQDDVRQCQALLQQLQHHNRAAGRGGDEVSLQHAAQRLHQARKHLGTVRHHKREIEQAIQSYMRQAQQLDHYLSNEVPRAAALLDKKLDTLNQYLYAATSTAPAAAAQPRSPEADAQSKTFTQTATLFLAKMIWVRRINWEVALTAVAFGMDALAGLAQQAPVPDPYDMEPHAHTACVPIVHEQSNSPISPDFKNLNDAQDLAKEQRKNENKAGRTEQPTSSAGDRPPEGWIDRGIQHVRLADLPHPDGINGPDDFRKVNLETMQAGIRRLQEMQPIIESDDGQRSDYWAQVDQQHGLSYDQGYQRIYEAFYGDTAIKLERIGNQYTIINGRHRVWLAKQIGIETLPARVTERQAG